MPEELGNNIHYILPDLPESEVDHQFSRKAPEGKFRVVGVDTFDDSNWLEGDFDTLDKAKSYALDKMKGEQMLKMHVYDDTGSHRYEAGTL